MKNDKDLINEAEYVTLKARYKEASNDYLTAAIVSFEGIVDAFAELGECNPDMDIYRLIYKNWNKVAKSTVYSDLSDICRHLCDYMLTKYWLFGDVFSGMIRDGEILSTGHCIGHSLDTANW